MHPGLVAVLSAVVALSIARPLDRDVADASDLAVRSERSTNLSHLTGTARKIQMFIRHRHLQILPDGSVNGTTDDLSAYTILQRTSVNKGQLKIQGVATCLYLCMDVCGLLYGSAEFTKDCVFNEMFEKHNYNTYSSARYSDSKQTLYLALKNDGMSRKVILAKGKPLGRLSGSTRVLTKHLPPERHRHHGQLCPAPTTPATPAPDARDKLRCRRRRKRRKRRRRCRGGGGGGGDDDDAQSRCDERRRRRKANHKNRQNKANRRNVGGGISKDLAVSVSARSNQRDLQRSGDSEAPHVTSSTERLPSSSR